MVVIDVQSNVRQQLEKLEGARRDLRDKAIVRALNRTAENVRAEAVREIRKTYMLKAGLVRGQMSISRAWSGKLQAAVTANGKPIPIYEFNATWNPKWSGVRFKVKKGERKTLRHTFIAKMKSGKVGVFERIDAGPMKTRPGALTKHSQKIEQKFSIGMPGMFGAKEVQSALRVVTYEKFDQNFAQQVKFLFGPK